MGRQPFNPDLISLPEERGAASTRRPAAKREGAGQRGPLTVSQVTALVKQALAASLPPTVHVVGEISNFKRHGSGHLYLTLKDAASELSCVMWRSAAASLKFAPQDGLEVIATGAVEVFERAGRYQLYVRKLEPRGVGALDLAFRQLREKLNREGLFDERHKKPWRRVPRRIALVTSPTGAAVADMVRTLGRRFPCVAVLLYPVRVQGPSAAREIAGAIERINANAEALGGVDLMIVGRGGGSLEELWAFNEEPVARAIHASRIPIISAVGHEVDVTIADLVADVRAATPTAAAELAVPVLDDLLGELDACGRRLTRAVHNSAQRVAARFDAVTRHVAFRRPLEPVHRREQLVDEVIGRMHRGQSERLRSYRRRLDRLAPVIGRIAPHALLRERALKLRDAGHRLRWALSHRMVRAERAVQVTTGRLDRRRPAALAAEASDRLRRLSEGLSRDMRRHLGVLQERLRRDAELLGAVGYRRVLGRGFSITRVKKGRAVVRSLEQLTDGRRLVTELADGQFESDVVNLTQRELFD